MKKLTIPMTRSETVLGGIYMVFQLLFLPVIIVTGNRLLGDPLSETQANFVFFCVNFICITVIFHRYLISSAKLALASPFWCLQSAFMGFAAYWLLNYITSMAIVMLYPDFSNMNDSSIMEMTRDNYTLMSFATVLLVPVAEEVLYRGLIFRGLYNRSRFTAYTISALVFSAIHVVGYITLYEPVALLLSFIQYLPAGLCLAWAYARADTIWAPILIHITVNQIGILSMR